MTAPTPCNRNSFLWVLRSFASHPCYSPQAPIVHPDKMDLFPGVSRGGGFQLWAPAGKGPPLRAPPGDTLPELDATEGRHIIGKVRRNSSKPLDGTAVRVPFFISVHVAIFHRRNIEIFHCGAIFTVSAVTELSRPNNSPKVDITSVPSGISLVGVKSRHLWLVHNGILQCVRRSIILIPTRLPT